jgi:hypothetical protein
MRPIIQHMVNHYPGARHNLLRSIYNDAHVDLWVPLKEKKENEKRLVIKVNAMKVKILFKDQKG